MFSRNKLQDKTEAKKKKNTDNISVINLLAEGRAIAQVLSRRLPTAAARVQNRVWSCGIL
jgi:hypothetical protein